MSSSAFTPTVLTIPASGSSGSGTGEISAITNGQAVTDTTGWTGATRVSSNSPLAPVISTAFEIQNSFVVESATSGAYATFTMPTGLRQRKLKVEFFFNTPATDSYRVSVYKGGSRVPLTTDAGGFSALPSGVTGGKYVGFFETDGTSSWTVNVTRVTGATGPCQFTNVIVGPGIQPQGAVLGPWTSFTPTITNGGTTSLNVGQYRRVGDSMEMVVQAQFTSTGSGSVLSVALPTGFTLNTTAIPGYATDSVIVGASRYYNGTTVFITTATTNSGFANSFIFGKPATSNSLLGTDFASGTSLEFTATIPIAEWAGSGTVNLAQNDVEYAYNIGNVTAANGTDTSSFGYGPSGTPLLAFNSATGSFSETKFTVRFQTPIQTTDDIALEFLSSIANAKWQDVTRSGMSKFVAGASAFVYGAGIQAGSTSNEVIVAFGNGGQNLGGAAYNTAGDAWTSLTTWRWRVRKSAAGAAVGFGIVVPGTSSGLVSASGVTGNTTGNAIASGYVGETPGSTTRAGTGGNGYDIRATTSFNTSTASLVSATLNKGVYLVGGVAQVANTGTARNVGYWLAVGGTQVSDDFSAYCGASGVLVTVTIPSMVIVITADSTVVDLRGQFNSSSTAANYKQSLHLARLA